MPYPFDPTGLQSSNLVVDELRVVQAPTNPTDPNFFVPLNAPFFHAGLVLKNAPGPAGVPYTQGVDYYIAHNFVEASLGFGSAISGSIVFLDSSFSGNVYMTYQTLGGDFVVDNVTLIEQLTRQLYNINFVTWSQLTNLPAGFAPLPHQHNPSDELGYAGIFTALQQIRDAILNQSGIPTHTHTKAQVGLSFVQNYPVAVLQDYLDGMVQRYATAGGVKEYVEQAISAALSGFDGTVEVLPNGGITGDGSLLEPLQLDPAYMAEYVPTGVLPVSQVGDVAEKYLPIDSGYFSVRYPRHDTQPTGTAYIENDGRLSALTPATNGEVLGLVYAQIKRYTNGQTIVQPTNVPYNPVGLVGSEYIHSVFPASKTGMIGEVFARNNDGTVSFVEFVFIELNGTLEQESHKLYRLDAQLENILLARLGSYVSGNSALTVRLGCPVCAVVPGLQAVIFMALPDDSAEIIPLSVVLNSVTGNASVSLQGGWLSQKGTSTYTGNTIRFYNGLVSAVNTDAFIHQPDLVDYTFSVNSTTQRYTLSLGQDGRNLRVRVGRQISVSKNGVSATDDFAYSFNTVYGDQIADIDSVYASAPAITYTLSGSELVCGEIFDHWWTNHGGAVSQRYTITILEDGSEMVFQANNPNTGGGYSVIHRRTDGVRTSAYVAANPYGNIGSPVRVSLLNLPVQDITPSLHLPSPTAIDINCYATLMNHDVIYGWGDERGQNRGTAQARQGWSCVIDNSDTKTYNIGEYGQLDGVALTTERLELLERTCPRLVTKFHDGFYQHSSAVFTHQTTLPYTDTTGHLRVELVGNDLVFTEPVTLTAANKQALSDELLLILESATSTTPGFFTDWGWGIYVLPDDDMAIGAIYARDTRFTPNRMVHVWVEFLTVTVVGSTLVIDTTAGALGLVERTLNNGVLNALNISLGQQLRLTYVGDMNDPISPNRLDILAREPIHFSGLGGIYSGGLVNISYGVGGLLGQAIDAGVSQALTPAYYSPIGLGYITPNIGYGVPYVFVPMNFSTNREPDIANAFLLTSVKPADGFILNITQEIPVFMQGRTFQIPIQEIDLSTVKPNPANTTFFVYAVIEAGIATLRVSENPETETTWRMYLGVVVTDGEIVISPPLRAISRFGIYRPSETPIGSAFSVSGGRPDQTTNLAWDAGDGGASGVGPVMFNLIEQPANLNALILQKQFPRDTISIVGNVFLNIGNIDKHPLTIHCVLSTIDTNEVITFTTTEWTEFTANSAGESDSLCIPFAFAYTQATVPPAGLKFHIEVIKPLVADFSDFTFFKAAAVGFHSNQSGIGVGGGGSGGVQTTGVFGIHERGAIGSDGGTGNILFTLPPTVKALSGTVTTFVTTPDNLYGPDVSLGVSVSNQTPLESGPTVQEYFLMTDYKSGLNTFSFSVILEDRGLTPDDVVTVSIIGTTDLDNDFIKFDFVGQYIV